MNPTTHPDSSQSGAKTPSSASPPKNVMPSAAAEFEHGLADGARDVGESMKHLAQDVAGQSKKTAETALTIQKDVAVKSAKSVALALRKTGDQLSGDTPMLTDYMGKAADRIERASSYIQTRTLGQLMNDVQDFARREPALALGGCFVAGLLGGRFLRASAPRRPIEASPPPSTSASSKPYAPTGYSNPRSAVSGSHDASEARSQGTRAGRQASGQEFDRSRRPSTDRGDLPGDEARDTPPYPATTAASGPRVQAGVPGKTVERQAAPRPCPPTAPPSAPPKTTVSNPDPEHNGGGVR